MTATLGQEIVPGRKAATPSAEMSKCPAVRLPLLHFANERCDFARIFGAWLRGGTGYSVGLCAFRCEGIRRVWLPRFSAVGQLVAAR